MNSNHRITNRELLTMAAWIRRPVLLGNEASSRVAILDEEMSFTAVSDWGTAG